MPRWSSAIKVSADSYVVVRFAIAWSGGIVGTMRMPSATTVPSAPGFVNSTFKVPDSIRASPSVCQILPSNLSPVGALV